MRILLVRFLFLPALTGMVANARMLGDTLIGAGHSLTVVIGKPNPDLLPGDQAIRRIPFYGVMECASSNFSYWLSLPRRRR
jgi:hypothetical protein